MEIALIDYDAGNIHSAHKALERAGQATDHRVLERVSPLAVPVLCMIGRESMPAGAADDDLLLEAEGLAAIAMG